MSKTQAERPAWSPLFNRLAGHADGEDLAKLHSLLAQRDKLLEAAKLALVHFPPPDGWRPILGQSIYHTDKIEAAKALREAINEVKEV